MFHYTISPANRTRARAHTESELASNQPSLFSQLSTTQVSVKNPDAFAPIETKPELVPNQSSILSHSSSHAIFNVDSTNYSSARARHDLLSDPVQASAEPYATNARAPSAFVSQTSKSSLLREHNIPIIPSQVQPEIVITHERFEPHSVQPLMRQRPAWSQVYYA